VDPTIDIFAEGVAPPPKLRYTPEPDFDQVIQFTQDPEAFRTMEAIEGRYKKGRIDIARKRQAGGYGVGDDFDRSAFEADFRKLNEALEMGMPARIFPAFTPYTAKEADMVAGVSQAEAVPSMAQQIVSQTRYGDRETERMKDRVEPLGAKVAGLQEGIGSLLGRFSGGTDDQQFILRREGRKPEIKLFKREGTRGMPDQTGIQFTRRF
tara:strand:- start:98 stop:724 length:627 start_codon:yes stop_codon:yes gene_type:complete